MTLHLKRILTVVVFAVMTVAMVGVYAWVESPVSVVTFTLLYALTAYSVVRTWRAS